MQALKRQAAESREPTNKINKVIAPSNNGQKPTSTAVIKPLTFSQPARILRSTASATQETKNFSDIFTAIMKLHTLQPSKRLIFLVDLDKTVHTAADATAGSDHWFEAQLARGHNPGELLKLYHLIQQHVEVEPAEEDTVRYIKQIQKAGIEVYAVTARSTLIAAATFRQLASINVDFNRGPWKDHNLDLGIGGSELQNGIMFCNGQNKAQCIENGFSILKVELNNLIVVFADDRRKHVDLVHAAMTKLGVQFMGFRYGHLDHVGPEIVDHEISDLQVAMLEELNILLSDTQAAKVLTHKNLQKVASKPRAKMGS